MATANQTKHTAEEYLFALRRKTDELKARTDLPRYRYPANEQDKVVAHFLQRATQLSEACYRVGEMPTPLRVLSRVLCDDLIRLSWVSMSVNNAAEYVKTAISEHAKILRINLRNKRGTIKDRNTGQDVTGAFLPQLAAFITKGKSVEQIAAECGLSKLYDIPFRFDSLETHGNTFLGEDSLYDDPAASSLAALPGVIAFVTAIILMADNYPEATAADDILRTLRLDKIAG